MLYIGFSNYSTKLHAKLFCKKYKHCAPIIVNKDCAVIYQFVHINKIVQIPVQKKDLQKLVRHGWALVRYSKGRLNTNISHGLTCVQFTKRMCGIKVAKIQTPLGLFRYLSNK